MIIDVVSDLHGHYPQLEGGDLLIVAGDLTARDDFPGWLDFIVWLQLAKYKKKIIIGGNHDNWLILNPPDENTFGDNCSYLCDSGTEFEYTEPIRDLFNPDEKSLVYRKKLKIWGSPWTLRFPGMNPHCMAFTCETEEELAEKWDLIPDDVDILVTHSPPWGIQDKTIHGELAGSKTLACRVGRMEFPFPKVWVWGHIHEAYGRNLPVRARPCIMINASHVNERYEPVNKPIRIEL